MKLNKQIAKVLEEHRLDNYLEALIGNVPWDDLMLAFANVCVFKANACTRDGKEYKAWFKRAQTFHKTIEDGRKATVQKRKVNKELKELEEDGLSSESQD
jgi:hypothetical protein